MFSKKSSRLNRFTKDLKKVWKGFIALIGNLTVRDTITHSLSLLSTPTISAKAGRPSCYDSVVANNTQGSSWLRVSFDIFRLNTSKEQNGHIAYYEKKIFVHGKESKAVRVMYDWLNKAFFSIDGITFQPDTYWQADHVAPGGYIVVVTLLTSRGVIINNLAIAQELSQ